MRFSFFVIAMGAFLNLFGAFAQSSNVPMQIIFASTYSGPQNIFSIHADGTNLRPLEQYPGQNIDPTCDLSENRIAFSSEFLNGTSIDVMNSSDGSGRTSITMPEDFTFSNFNPTWSPNGTRIAFAVNRTSGSLFDDLDLYIMNADGSNITPLFVESTFQDGPSWSPSGNLIAFSTIVMVGGRNEEIFVINPDGSNLTRITNLPGDDRNPAWSPDSSKIVFNSNRDGDDDIYIMNADGTNVVQITNDPSFDITPAWSPDGTQIAFTSGRSESGNAAIYVMNADGTNIQRLTDPSVDSFSPCWLPLTSTLAIPLTMEGRATTQVPATVSGQTFDVVLSQNDEVKIDVLVTASTSNSNGVLTIPNIPYGDYTVWVKHPQYLSEPRTINDLLPVIAITTPNVTMTANPLSFRAGDANDDNLVNITDFSLLATSFGKTIGTIGFDSRTDFNADGIVNISDFSLLATNFGQIGATDPTPNGSGSRSALPPQLANAALTLTRANNNPLSVNGTFNVTVRAGNAGSAANGITASSIDAAEVHLTFDPAKLRVESITSGTGLTTPLQSTFNNAAGTLDVAYGRLSGTANNLFTVFTVTFRALASTSGTPTVISTSPNGATPTLLAYRGATRAVTGAPLMVTIQ